MVAVFAASNVMRRWGRGRLAPDHDNDGIASAGPVGPDANVLPQALASTVALTAENVVMRTVGGVQMTRIRKRFSKTSTQSTELQLDDEP